MCRVISVKGKFKILQGTRGYIVVNTERDYKAHAHIKKRQTAERLIILLLNNKMPYNQYLKGSTKRLLSEDEFNNLSCKRKMKYKNRR